MKYKIVVGKKTGLECIAISPLGLLENECLLRY